MKSKDIIPNPSSTPAASLPSSLKLCRTGRANGGDSWVRAIATYAIYVIFFCFSSILSAQTVIFIVHGTWAHQADWHQPNGDFHTELKQRLDLFSSDALLENFIWSGSNRHSKRLEAAYDLVDKINACDPSDSIVIISHSHGTNVVLLASQIIAQMQLPHVIEKLYALGTPIDVNLYSPNMSVVKHLYNLFSFKDMVQPVLGIFDRQFPEHDRIANICITINGDHPNHSSLHCSTVAKWLLHVHEQLSEDELCINDQFSFMRPAYIHFFDDASPCYVYDEKRTMMLQGDKALQDTLAPQFLRKVAVINYMREYVMHRSINNEFFYLKKLGI